MDLHFIPELPAKGHAGGVPSAYIQALRENPGQWAEIARYPIERRGSASSRGQQMTQRHSDIECATRTVGDEVILFLRAVSE